VTAFAPFFEEITGCEILLIKWAKEAFN
jgi:hypothetical protein